MHGVFCEDKYPSNLFVYSIFHNIKEIGSHKRKPYSQVNIRQYSKDTYTGFKEKNHKSTRVVDNKNSVPRIPVWRH